MADYRFYLDRVLTKKRSGIDTDLQVYLNSLVTPLSTGQVGLLNTFVTTLKSGLGITNLSDVFDVMYILGNETEEAGLKNLVKRAHDATLSATAPTFTALEGFTGNASSAFIDTNYNPSTQGVNYQLNNAGAGIYSRTERGVDAEKYEFGALDTINILGINIHRDSGLSRMFLNNNTGANIPSTGAKGMYGIYRNNPLTLYANINGITTPSNRDATNIPNLNVYIFALNSNGINAIHTDSQLAFYFIGSALTGAEIDILINTFETYMNANGKGVII